MSTLATVSRLKEENQDFEWYPTTNEIIDSVYYDLRGQFSSTRNRWTQIKLKSILDIGAGDGRVLKRFNDHEKGLEDEHGNSESCPFKLYAIEKSRILIEQMDKDIFILGTDFYQQTLIDKKVDVIFCNPPYSDYSTWMSKIIREANSKRLYFVVPNRWKDNEEIKHALSSREVEARSIGEFDFINADRQARAKVNVVRVDLQREDYDRPIGRDPFTLWFNEKFSMQKTSNFVRSSESLNTKLNSLTTKKDLIPKLEESYNEDMTSLFKLYKAFEDIDPSLLREMSIDVKNIQESLRVKIENLKATYWKKLFDNLDSITNRLTSKTRDKMLSQLTANNQLDFTSSNAYAIVIWAIKNANQYYDEQLIDVYSRLTKKENIELYVSNHRIYEDGWRYQRQEFTHYKLDYRIVNHFYSAIREEGNWSQYGYDYENGLSNSAHSEINDIFVIANNLGYVIETKTNSIEWMAGKKNLFYLNDGRTFAEIKAFKNGNLHFKFLPEFMMKFNIEAARLNGWVKNAQEASKEMNYNIDDVEKLFNSNFQLTNSNMLLLA